MNMKENVLLDKSFLYAIIIVNATNFFNLEEFESLKLDASELLKILKSSILTVKQKLYK